MTEERLQSYVKLLFGGASNRLGLLSDALDVNQRTIRRWLNGSNPIPQHLEAELHMLLLQRQKQINAFLERS